MTAVIHLRCSECDTALTDRYSRAVGLDAKCRADLTDAELRTATARHTERPTRPASPQARRNHAEVERVTSPTPAAKLCAHGDAPAGCALCRRDNDPWRSAERIIAITQRLPMTERLQAERAASRHHWRAYLPIPTQLTIGG